MFVVLVVTLFTTRILLQKLGVIDYGVYNVVCGFVAMFSFLNTSMTNGIQRFYNYSLGNKREYSIQDVFNTALKIQLILCCVIVLLTESVGIWYINNKMVIPADRFYAAKWVFQLSIISFVMGILQVPYRAAIMSHERMDYYAFVSILDAFLKLAIAFSITLFSSDHLVVYGFLMLGISILNFLLYFSYAKLNFCQLKICRSSSKLFGPMLSFSGWNIFGAFSGMMKEQGINMLLNLFFGPIVNAARGVAHQVNGAVHSLVINLSTAVRPQVIQSYAAGNTDRTMKLTYSISKISIGVLFLASLPIILEIDFILKVWLGSNVPEHTNTFIKIVLVTSFVNTLNTSISGVIHASGKMMLYQVVTSSISLLCIPMAYITLNSGSSPEMAFLSVLIFATLAQIASLFILKKIVNYSIIDYHKRVILPFIMTALSSFIFPVLVNKLLPEGTLRFVMVFVIAIISIIPAIYFILLDKSERKVLNTIVKNFINRSFHK